MESRYLGVSLRLLSISAHSSEPPQPMGIRTHWIARGQVCARSVLGVVDLRDCAVCMPTAAMDRLQLTREYLLVAPPGYS